jgi:hypothetical protein
MHEVDWSLWTAWTPLDPLEWSSMPTGPGAYIIAAPQPITRAVGTDLHGYLDVGESAILNTRLWGFRRCATQRGTTGHMAGWRYAFFHFDRQFPFTTLRVRWRKTITKEEAYAAEGQVLLGYLRRHCEPPRAGEGVQALLKQHGWVEVEPGSFALRT